MTSKNYKKCLDRCIKKYQYDRHKIFREKSKHDPKDFWKALNSKTKVSDEHIPNAKIFYDFYKDLNNIESEILENPTTLDNTFDTDILNRDITEEEITKAIKSLKRGKSPGIDLIENDHLKDSAQYLLPLLSKYFNQILDSGILPECWLTGIIKPIYKGKGDNADVNSYRPITLLSCFGKLFTSILNTRLKIFLENNNILTPAQAGFRKNFSVIDNIFVIQTLIDLLKVSKKKLYCVFVDFTKAFDTVWRAGLWHKMMKTGISGRFLDIVKNMYSDIESAVMVNQDVSPFFSCNSGVRQGENLSPLLFSIFVNDLENVLSNKTCKGINLECSEDNFTIFIQLLILLYADDIVLFSDNPNDLQKTLNVFNEYCKTWKLKVNLKKTKVVNFGGGPAKRCKQKLYFGEKEIELVDNLVKFRQFY